MWTISSMKTSWPPFYCKSYCQAAVSEAIPVDGHHLVKQMHNWVFYIVQNLALINKIYVAVNKTSGVCISMVFLGEMEEIRQISFPYLCGSHTKWFMVAGNYKKEPVPVKTTNLHRKLLKILTVKNEIFDKLINYRWLRNFTFSYNLYRNGLKRVSCDLEQYLPHRYRNQL
jgi:hypothetical protein